MARLNQRVVPIENRSVNVDERGDSTALNDDMSETLGALRQLTKEVKDLLLVANRELNETALWHLGQWWGDDLETHRRPNETRTLLKQKGRVISGAVRRTGGRNLR